VGRKGGRPGINKKAEKETETKEHLGKIQLVHGKRGKKTEQSIQYI
jgi:hypothetical protein